MKHDDYKYEFTVKRKNNVILITNNLNSVINTIRPGYINDNEKYISEMENKLMTLEFSAKSDNAQIRKLLKENQKLKIENLELKENAAPGTSSHNARGAGRKPKITQEQIEMIQMLRAQGKKLQEIQTETGISYGNVQKYCNLISDNKRAGL